MMNSVVIADDHELVRRGLRELVGAEENCHVVGEASDGIAATQAVQKFKPSLLLLDLNMPRLHGLEVLKHTRTTSPRTKIIVLSMHNDEPYVIEALRAGAMAYLLKGSESAEISQALRDVLAGRRYLSAPLSEWAISALATKTVESDDPLSTISHREREVLNLAAEGFGNTEIAEKLFISPRTAETHRTNMMRKLGLQSQTDLVRFAIRRSLIQA
jgi:DNA-binding NarL/FixJ family response regulator